jgi:flagellum-specific peptidoglycan hydrolase FlgJ
MAVFPPSTVDAAVKSATKWRIPASVTLAQWALESNYGIAMPPGSNNPFGIKARANEAYVTVKTQEFVNGKYVTVEARFRRFASMVEAFDEHGRLLSTGVPYFRAQGVRNNADAFADALTGVYATDPHYGSKLKAIMKANDLYKYDVVDQHKGPISGPDGLSRRIG